MGSLNVQDIVYDVKLSSVVPGSMTPENTAYDLKNMDLVMKLHYIKGVYYFNRSAIQGFTTYDFKFPMFPWLELYYATCGRIRKSESGRPFVKCNDSGVRIIEAQCSMTLEECLADKDSDVHNQLCRSQVLGPELAFCPLVLLQFTWFKCGGFSVGLSWAHVLGDVFSASVFMNMWGQIMAGKLPPKSLNFPKAPAKSESPPSTVTELLSITKIDISKDYWLAKNDCRMEKFSICLTATQLEHLQSKISKQSQTGVVAAFETLCAVIWHCLAKIRGDSSRIVTICKKDNNNREDWTFGNTQIIGAVKADFPIMETEPSELAAFIVKRLVDENSMIEDTVARDEGLSDFLVYGANLTFVDLEDVDLYGLKFKGQKPVFTNYSIDGTGEEGVVLVLPGTEHAEGSDGRGRTVSLTLPENEVTELREKLKAEWGIV